MTAEINFLSHSKTEANKALFVLKGHNGKFLLSFYKSWLQCIMPYLLGRILLQSCSLVTDMWASRSFRRE